MHRNLSCRIASATMMVLATMALAALTACGGGNTTPSAPTETPPSTGSTQPLLVKPSLAAIRINTTLKFSASENVTWSIREGLTGGTIGSDGLYTAPDTVGTSHVIATAVADSSRTATATVSVVQSGLSSTVANLASARFEHTATLLPDGDVLIAGGGAGTDSDHFLVVDQSEVFDSVHLTFVSAGQVTRVFHTATLLSTGQVLLAGGSADGFGTDLATAELYDPLTGKFQAAGNMASEREMHTATLLADGRVLIAGGRRLAGNGFETLRTAEIYDPVARTFSPTGSMNQARVWQTAILLLDGRVLIIGGYDNGPLTSAELYDPASGSFSTAGSMVVKREGYTATLLANGKVLITGGNYNDTTAELYDPTTGLFTTTGAMVTRRFMHTATQLPSGMVLVVGGAESGNALASVELYDPASGQFASAADLQTGRFSHTATLLSDGSVLIVGGDNGDGWHFKPLSSAEIYK